MWLRDVALSLCIPALGLLGAPPVAALDRRLRLALPLPTRLAAAFALGLAWMEAGAVLLGLSGRLYPGPVLAWLSFGGLLSLAVALREKGAASPSPSPAPDLALLTLSGLAALLLLLLATVPPWYRDELVYHLALPRLYAETHRLARVEGNFYSSLPQGWEALLSALFLFGRTVPQGGAQVLEPPFNPRLAGVWCLLFAAAALVGLARTAGASRRPALLAGLLFLLLPTAIEFGASAYTEPFLLLLSALALTFALRSADAGPAARACGMFAGLFAGLACTVKYTAFGLCAAIGAALLLAALRRPPAGQRQALGTFARFCGAAALAGSPFLLRNAIELGNPVFPLAFDELGGPGWDSYRAHSYELFLWSFGAGREPLDYLLLPLRIFAARDLDRAFEGSLGPAAGLGALSGLLLLGQRRLPRRRAAMLGLAALVLSFFWAFSTQQLRFYLVAALPLLALLALGLTWLEAVAGRRAAQGAVAGLAALSVGWTAPLAAGLWRRQETTAWLSGSVGRDELLARLLPESYPVYLDLPALVPPGETVWLVWMRGYTYYLDRPYRLDAFLEGWRLEALLEAAATPEAARAALARERIRYLLVNERFFLAPESVDVTAGRTALLAGRFAALCQSGLLGLVRRWGPVVLYRTSPTAMGVPAAPADLPPAPTPRE